MVLERIEIEKQFGMEELEDRLKNVRLKGFLDVKIYENSDIRIENFSPKEIERIFIPQPRVYRSFLNRIEQMAEVFSGNGIDIFNLDGGVDYTAYDENGLVTCWTIIPPVVEIVPIMFTDRGLDYTELIGERLRATMREQGHKLNPELANLFFPDFRDYNESCRIPIICDGSHRIHSAYEGGREQNLLLIDGPEPGYPYYAAPKPYSTLHVEAERTDGSKSDKTHVLTEPGHKLLYRLFPSGGILSGCVRPDDKPSH